MTLSLYSCETTSQPVLVSVTPDVASHILWVDERKNTFYSANTFYTTINILPFYGYVINHNKSITANNSSIDTITSLGGNSV